MKPALTKPSFLHLFRDYFIFQTSIGSLLGIGLGIYIYLEETEVYVAYLILGIAILSLLGLLFRVLWIYHLYNVGDIIEASVIHIRYNKVRHRNIGYVKLAYEYQREQCTKSFTIIRSEKTNQLNSVSKVEILVDPNHPKRVCLKSLFD